MATTTITGSVIDVQDAAQFDELTARESTLSISFFWADFHELCRPNGQIDVVVRQLATLHPRIRFLKIAAEELPELSERFQIAVVPTFVVAQGKSVLEKLEGANVAELAKRVDVLSKSIAKKAAADAASGSDAASASSAATATTASGIAEALEYRLKKLIKCVALRLWLCVWLPCALVCRYGSYLTTVCVRADRSASPVMLFMKGNPSDPKCGFSRQVVALLNEENIQYGTFDILNDEEVRTAVAYKKLLLVDVLQVAH